MSTDNIITKDEAIDRMKAGLPCESFWRIADTGEWKPTKWADFDSTVQTFRKPPEPRRAAIEAWCAVHGDGSFTPWPSKQAAERYADSLSGRVALFREVLPGDVVCERMTLNEALAKLREWGIPCREEAIGALYELGLIADKSALGEGP